MSHGNKKVWLKKICETCGIGFEVTPSRKNARFHNNKCRAKKVIPKNKILFQKGHIPWNKGLKGTKGFKKGKDNFNWKGGIAYQRDLDNKKLEEWRKQVFERDNYTCQKTKIKGGKIIAHHIRNYADYIEVRFDINNGITLQEEVHKEFHRQYGYKVDENMLQEFLVQ